MAQWKKVIVSGSQAHLAAVTASNLTNDNIVIAGTNGQLENTGLTYDGTDLNLTGATTISGSIISASAFVGDGSGLRNVTATDLDLDTFGSDLTGATLVTSDIVIVSDGGTDGRTTVGKLAEPIFGAVSGDIVISSAGVATIQPDAVVLGTDSTGDYVASLVAGTLIDLQNNTGEGATPTIDVDLTEAAAATIDIATDHIIFLDGGATGTASKGAAADLLSGAAGVGLVQNGTTKKLDVDYGTLTGQAARGNNTLTVTGTTDEITIDSGAGANPIGANIAIAVGLADTICANRTFSGNLITFNNDIQVDKSASVLGDLDVTGNAVINGDLTVNGTTTSINTENLYVEDRYILLNSGSSGNIDSGIVFGGTGGVAQSGSALIWDASYSGSDGRLAVVNHMAANSGQNETPDYFVAGVFEGTAANAATAQADHNGNIRIEAGEIYIYA